MGLHTKYFHSEWKKTAICDPVIKNNSMYDVLKGEEGREFKRITRTENLNPGLF